MTYIGLKLKDCLVLYVCAWVFAGYRFLGGYLVDYPGHVQYVSDKVWLWVTNLLSLIKIAVK